MDNDIYRVTVVHNSDECVKSGDVVSTTTSEFNYNSLTHCFDDDCNSRTVVIAEHIGEDYTDYDVRRCNNGGCYGYDYFKVISIE